MGKTLSPVGVAGFCPVCGTKDVKKIGYSEETTMGGGSPFPGPDGRVHVHDPNRGCFFYRCAAGHDYRVPMHACWCGWNNMVPGGFLHLEAP